MGMNSADMFYCVPGKGGIITYNRRKTASRRQDKAEMQVKIRPASSLLSINIETKQVNTSSISICTTPMSWYLIEP